jgi:hypothetical protein
MTDAPIHFVKKLFASTQNPVFICSLPNIRGDGPSERHLLTRQGVDIIRFRDEWDKPGRAIYICASTLIPHAQPLPGKFSPRCKENVSELIGLWVDIDLKNVRQSRIEVEQILANLLCVPSLTVFSGNGLHAYWLLRESLPATIDNRTRIEEDLRQVARALGGDPQVAEVARLMRLPGSHNSKEGAWTPVEIIDERPAARYELEQLEEEFVDAPILIQRVETSESKPNGGGASDPFERAGADPIDIDARLKAMRYGGAGDTSIHKTQLDVTASLLSRGVVLPEVVRRVLEATRSVAPPDARPPWNWTKEATDLVNMCLTWLAKHPDVALRQYASVQATPASTSTPEGWPDPIPLPSRLSPVLPFDPTFLPDAIAPWVMDIAERMQCAPDMVGVPAMAALGGVLGTKIGAYPKQEDNWLEVPNFWCVIIGLPGKLKSPALREVFLPVRELGIASKRAHDDAMKRWRGDLEAFKLRKDVAQSTYRKRLKEEADKPVSDFVEVREARDRAEAEKQQNEALEHVMRETEPPEPQERRYIVNDTTYEKLGEILSANPQGVIVERDELVSLLAHLDREEQATAKGFYLSGWNGVGVYDFDRISRGRVSLSRHCISLVGCATPGGIESYVRASVSEGRDDGLIQRFSLAVWPDQRPTWTFVDRAPDAAAKERVRQLFQRFNDYEPPVSDGEVDPYDLRIRGIRFTPEATEAFATWLRELETEISAGGRVPALLAHFSKYRKLVPTTALVTHLADHGSGQVRLSALHKALRFAGYLRSHAERIYGSVTRADIEGAHAIVAKLQGGSLVEPFTARDVYRRQWSGLRDTAAVYDALELLERHHFIGAQPNPRSVGRPALTEYRSNPKLWAR